MATGHKWYKPFQPFHMLHAFAAIILHNALTPRNLNKQNRLPDEMCGICVYRKAQNPSSVSIGAAPNRQVK